MRLVIFGATGSIGRLLVRQALATGHRVIAFARSPEVLQEKHPNLTLFAGDVLDPESVVAAVAGQDAVLITLGSGRKGTVRSEGTLNIIKAMQQQKVERLVCQSTLGCGGSWDNLNFLWKRIMFGLLLREAFADHQLQEMYVRDSLLKWTIVRPAAFTDGPVTDQYRHAFAENDRSVTLKISRGDVAAFMLKQLEDKTSVGKTPGLSY